MVDRSGAGLMMAGAVVTFVGLCIVLVKVFQMPDYAVLVVVGIGLFVLGLIRRLTHKGLVRSQPMPSHTGIELFKKDGMVIWNAHRP